MPFGVDSDAWRYDEDTFDSWSLKEIDEFILKLTEIRAKKQQVELLGDLEKPSEVKLVSTERIEKRKGKLVYIADIADAPDNGAYWYRVSATRWDLIAYEDEVVLAYIEQEATGFRESKTLQIFDEQEEAVKYVSALFPDWDVAIQ